MRPFGQKKTHASNGEELSQFFIDNEGLLSVFDNDTETEIVGFHQSPFGGGWVVIDK